MARLVDAASGGWPDNGFQGAGGSIKVERGCGCAGVPLVASTLEALMLEPVQLIVEL